MLIGFANRLNAVKLASRFINSSDFPFKNKSVLVSHGAMALTVIPLQISFENTRVICSTAAFEAE